MASCAPSVKPSEIAPLVKPLNTRLASVGFVPDFFNTSFVIASFS